MEQQRVVLLRRTFLAGLGLAVGGLALGVAEAAPPARDVNRPPPAPPTPGGAKAQPGLRTGVFLHIAPDGTVSIVSHRSEMGQGIRSSLPVLVADELGADMARVKIVQADGDKAYGDQNTDGSRSVRGGYEPMRRVGATARAMLVAAAARRWRVPAAECVAEQHAVHHAKSKRSLDFRELVADAAKLPVPDAEAVALRPASELKRVGGPLPLLDGPAIVTGAAQFGADVRLPGMLTAVIAHPPVVGGKVVRYDGARALAVPGVKKLVELPAPKGGGVGFQPLGGVAVVADTTWAAMRGRAALEIVWDHGANASYDSASYREALSRAVRAPGKVVRKVGDVDGALKAAARTVEAEYYVPHLAHVAMEPPVGGGEGRRGRLRGVGADAEPAGRADRGGAGARRRRGQGHRARDAPRRRLRPEVQAGLRRRGGAARARAWARRCACSGPARTTCRMAISTPSARSASRRGSTRAAR